MSQSIAKQGGEFPGLKPVERSLSEVRLPLLFIDYDDTMGKTEKPAIAAAAVLYNEIRHSFNLAPVSEADFHSICVGRTFRQVLNELVSQHSLSPQENYVELMVAEEMQRAILTFERNGVEAADGVEDALEKIQKLSFPRAVVSSSHIARLQVCLRVTNQARFFVAPGLPDGLVFSAQTSLQTPTPKPAPDIYLHARRVVERHHNLEARSTIGIAIEDSSSGVRSAKAAGMFTIGYVGVQPLDKRAATARRLFDQGAHIVISDWRDSVEVAKQLQTPATENVPVEKFGPNSSRWTT